LNVDVFVENLTATNSPPHTLPVARWLHLLVHDRDGNKVFESGALNSDGSIQATTMMPTPRASSRTTQKITSAD